MDRCERVRDLLRTAERHTVEGRYARAVRFYRRVLQLTRDGDYERELAHARLGDLHLGLGQADFAIPHLARAQRLSGGEPEYALMLGRALVAVGASEAAAASLYDALASPYHATEALGELARTLADADRRGAARLARHAAERDPRFHSLARSLADA